MSNRSMLEFNHDYTPNTLDARIKFANNLCNYLASGNPSDLPEGVAYFGMRHHTEKCPLGDPPNGWDNRGK